MEKDTYPTLRALLPPGSAIPAMFPLLKAAEVIGVSRPTVYKLIDGKKLERVSIGSRAGVTPASLEKMLAGMRAR